MNLHVDCNGKSGGLCLFWKDNVKVEVLYSDCNVIHTFVSNMNTNNSFHYSFVYGNPTSQHRKSFWEKLRTLHPQNQNPWICSGDFDEILHQSDKCGIEKHPEKQIQIFKNFLASKNMEELPQKGSKFTWCNNRITGTVHDKLDRCIANWEWRKIYPNATVTALVPITSDHSPLIINASPSDHHKMRSFKFEPYWAEHEEFTTIIQQSWKQNGENITTNLSNIRANLEEWSKQTFKRADIKIKQLKKAQKVIQSPTYNRKHAAKI